jgi:hypothetical protein
MTVVNKDFVVNNGLQITGYITSVGGSTPSNGQLLIGDATNGRFSVGSLTGSNGISFTQGAGTINITTNATPNNTVSTIVSRDSAGAFTAGVITGVAAQKALIASNGSGTGQTSIMLSRVGAATDNKNWEILASSTGTLSLRTVNDAYSSSTNGLVLTRDSAYGITNVQFPSGNILVGTGTDDGVNKLQVSGTISATTPVAGSNNTQVATTAFVTSMAGDYQSWTYLNGATTLSSANSGSVYFCGSTGGYTVTLPAPTTANWKFTLTNVTTDSTNITLSTPSAAIYNQTASAATFTLGVGATVVLLSDGSNWTVLSYYTKSPNFLGTPTAPTAAAGTNNTQLATTAFVATSFAPINNPTFTGRVYIPEGTAAAPGLSFVNDGAIDTGLYHISDGVFGITCNTVSQVQFSNSSGTTFQTAVTIPSGTINNASIGATTPSTGKFTTLTTTSTTTFGGRTIQAGATYTAAGATQATGTAITTDLCFVNAGSANAGVVLPPVAMGATCFVVNYSGNSIVVYPPSGAYLDFGAQNAGSTMANQTRLMFCSDGGSWFSMNATYA